MLKLKNFYDAKILSENRGFVKNLYDARIPSENRAPSSPQQQLCLDHLKRYKEVYKTLLPFNLSM